VLILAVVNYCQCLPADFTIKCGASGFRFLALSSGLRGVKHPVVGKAVEIGKGGLETHIVYPHPLEVYCNGGCECILDCCDDVLRRLETELKHLKHKFQSGQELKLECSPNNGPKGGEVTGTTIRI